MYAPHTDVSYLNTLQTVHCYPTCLLTYTRLKFLLQIHLHVNHFLVIYFCPSVLQLSILNLQVGSIVTQRILPLET